MGRPEISNQSRWSQSRYRKRNVAALAVSKRQLRRTHIMKSALVNAAVILVSVSLLGCGDDDSGTPLSTRLDSALEI